MPRLLALALLLFASAAAAADVVTTPPTKPDPAKTYVFYLHGKVVEEKGPHAVDPRFGMYDYPAILDALGSRGAVVISAQREQDTDVATYAGSVVGQVERLVAAGVPESHIVIVGFSKGGAIAARISSFLRRPDVRFVLLAACWRPDEPQLRLTGRVLSIREKSDTLSPYSCKPLAEKAEKPTSFEEVIIDTGLSHGAFYVPRAAWTKPTLDYINGTQAR
jgi:predicted esterase